jgi:type VI secretion system protein ImpL
MTIKSLFFCIFLYVCLVWVGAAYLYPGRMQELGLLWTAIGLIAVLGFLVISRLWSWLRIWRAKASMKPKTPPKPALPVHEDDEALAALVVDARAALEKRVGIPGNEAATRLSHLPLYLLIGPENSGKTSTFLNAGLEPVALAGQATSSGQAISTRLGNIWLAKNALFVELAGRTFSGDLGRWVSLLRVLRGQSSAPLWRRLISETDPGLSVRAILAFCDVKEFTASSSPQGRENRDRQSRHWRERLSAITEVFGAELPVYLLASKSDSLPCFGDYFARMREPDIHQVFGCSLRRPERTAQRFEDASAEAENKRLTKSFSPLLHSLAEKRLTQLAHEPDPARRPGIYEFPRELRRIRPTMVQFLVDIFRPHPLRLTPFLRGYYFTGTREEDLSTGGGSTGGNAWAADQSEITDATGIFRADATQIFRREDATRGVRQATRSGLARQWAFVSELFQGVVLSDRLIETAAPKDGRVELYRKVACGAVCGLCLLLCAAFFTSWSQNLGLLHAMDSAADGAADLRRHAKPTLGDLESLESLRVETSRLLEYSRDGAPWRMRWGLYSGNDVASAARSFYFRRFNDLLLGDLNGTITSRLETVPSAPSVNDPYEPVARLLKAHLMISSGACRPEGAFAASVLKQTRGETMQTSGSAWGRLADRQIDFYAAELAFGNPVRLSENLSARDHARQYLRNIQGIDRIYGGILARADGALTKPQRLTDLVPNYAQALSGPEQVSGIFTRDGWNYVEKASKNVSGNSLGEACVVGPAPNDERKHDANLERAIQRMFIRDYVEHWRNFVSGFSVRRYASAADAAHKLEMLADHKSPLLGLLAMTSNQTNFPAPAAPAEGIEKFRPPLAKIFPGLKNAPKAPAPSSDAQTRVADALDDASGITRIFQPVHWVVPAASDTWVVEKNGAYVDALSQLAHSMQDIAKGGDPDPAVYQTASQNYDKALDAARQLSRGFEPVGVEGLDGTVQRLIEAPIRTAHAFIPADATGVGREKVNGELRAFCGRIRNSLRKYPFRSSGEDLSLDELTAWFAPQSGGISKFAAEALGELTVKDGSHWKQKDGAKLQLTPEMLLFLNRAQAITDAFYPAGATQPRLTYTLRPKLDTAIKEMTVELDVDGQAHQWTSSLQKQFSWPAPQGSKDVGAKGRLKTSDVSVPFASRGGIWGIFRVMGDAEPRPLGGKLIEWKYLRGGDGRLEQIQPPVRLEIVEFPSGIDVFNPSFFSGLECPGRAVQ